MSLAMEKCEGCIKFKKGIRNYQSVVIQLFKLRDFVKLLSCVTWFSFFNTKFSVLLLLS